MSSGRARGPGGAQFVGEESQWTGDNVENLSLKLRAVMTFGDAIQRLPVARNLATLAVEWDAMRRARWCWQFIGSAGTQKRGMPVDDKIAARGTGRVEPRGPEQRKSTAH